VFEYQSTYFCQSSAGADQSAWAADTDVGVLDENLMELGVIWRFKKKNGWTIPRISALTSRNCKRDIPRWRQKGAEYVF
jgi:hypothetical protein